MTDQDDDFDDDDGWPRETCPFCGRTYPGEEEAEYYDWWGATECEHLCCFDCTDWSGCVPLCPTCAREEKERDGKAT